MSSRQYFSVWIGLFDDLMELIAAKPELAAAIDSPEFITSKFLRNPQFVRISFSGLVSEGSSKIENAVEGMES